MLYSKGKIKEVEEVFIKYATSDGLTWNTKDDAISYQKDLDFNNWYNDCNLNYLWCNGSKVQFNNLRLWLLEHKTAILEYLNDN